MGGGGGGEGGGRERERGGILILFDLPPLTETSHDENADKCTQHYQCSRDCTDHRLPHSLVRTHSCMY